MENPKNKCFIINHSTHGSDAGRRRTHQANTLEASLTDSKEIQPTENRRKRSVGRRPRCKEIDEKAQEYHTYKLTKDECMRYKSNWNMSLNNSRRNGPMASRHDFRAAVA